MDYPLVGGHADMAVRYACTSGSFFWLVVIYFLIYSFMDRFDCGSRQHVCYMIIFAANTLNIGGEFGDVGKVSLSISNPWI